MESNTSFVPVFFEHLTIVNVSKSFKNNPIYIIQATENPASPGIMKLWVYFGHYFMPINVKIRRKIYINSLLVAPRTKIGIQEVIKSIIHEEIERIKKVFVLCGSSPVKLVSIYIKNK